MVTMMETYASELKLISKEPHYNKSRAMKHFFLLMDFEHRFLPLQKELTNGTISRSKALERYSELRGISVNTLYRIIVAYRNKGIRGLLPHFGSKSKRLYTRQNNKLKATITIDPQKPLKCLFTIKKIIERCHLIDPQTKNKSLSILRHYFNGVQTWRGIHLKVPLTDEEKKVLLRYKASKHKWHSRRATAILMINDGKSLMEIIEKTNSPENTIYRWLHKFKLEGVNFVKVKVNNPSREKIQTEKQTRVIDIIHKTPALFGINRTTWTYGAISEAYLAEYGTSISESQIQRIIQNTNYTWRRAKKVLTSPDPEYKTKVEKLLETLQGLKCDERFFFIDEVGPYRVKKYGGRILVPRDQTITELEGGKSRGRIQFVAALEAVTNQLIWLFTPDKGARSMVRLLEKIIKEYAVCPTVYLTWDAITVHSSKVVTNWITSHNETVIAPHIEVVPLPSNAQFLNVIEAVFGGMKKAVICNSDYATPLDMQMAIAGYFEERNAYYRENPKRAGNKIWDKQKFDFDKLAGGLFKKM